MAFVALGLLELIHSFNIKSEGSVLRKGILNNKFLIGSFVLGALLQIVVVVIPYFANIFSLVTLNQTQWIYTIMISLLPLPIIEMQKWINKIRFRKDVGATNKCIKIC